MAAGTGGSVALPAAADRHHQPGHEEGEHRHDGQQNNPPSPVDGGGKRPDRIAQRSHAQTLREIRRVSGPTRRSEHIFSGSSFHRAPDQAPGQHTCGRSVDRASPSVRGTADSRFRGAR